MRKREAVWIRGFRAGLVGDPGEHGYTGGNSNAWRDGHAIGNALCKATAGDYTVAELIQGVPIPTLSPHFNPWR